MAGLAKIFMLNFVSLFVISLLELRADEKSLGVNMLHFIEEIEFEKSNLQWW